MRTKTNSERRSGSQRRSGSRCECLQWMKARTRASDRAEFFIHMRIAPPHVAGLRHKQAGREIRASQDIFSALLGAYFICGAPDVVCSVNRPPMGPKLVSSPGRDNCFFIGLIAMSLLRWVLTIRERQGHWHSPNAACVTFSCC